MAEKEWYSAGEAAEYLGITGDRLAHLRREKRIKAVTGGGKNTRYAMYHIDELKKVDISDQRKKVSESAGKQDEEDKQEGRDTTVMLGMSRNAARLVGAAS